ncbi:hypothetical protein BGW36DRAFT_366704 [Talaromyces proteolyticus]|uniref:Uncharacterized protein n=1 Tax=Talaromyces proteolyticus TaxID=1131652 RepID=A0AAD4Q664_9EURO|nr:uncharacterized protein BGW36DRAFT_366704 [Talaromyces proteolyticus]KAH8705042.1 hypothetical protein BGW36DRAFT_366704 [Talaromyces proteolyticus]
MHSSRPLNSLLLTYLSRYIFLQIFFANFPSLFATEIPQHSVNLRSKDAKFHLQRKVLQLTVAWHQSTGQSPCYVPEV